MYGEYRLNKNNDYEFVALGKAVYVEKVYKNLETNDITLSLMYQSFDKELITFNIERKYITEKDLSLFIAKGIEVTRKTFDIFAKSIFEQEEKAEHLWTSTSLGWVKHNEELLFIGENSIGKDSLIYDGALYIDTKGSFDEWLSFVNSLNKSTPLIVSVIMGLSCNLYGFLSHFISGIESVVYHIINDSSKGKTTSAKLYLSTSSCPNNLRQNASINTQKQLHSNFLSWGSTSNSIYASIRNNNGFPVVIDDSSLADKFDHTQFLYSLIEGKEKARCDKDSKLRESSYWSTNILSTGEQSLVEYSKVNNNGLRARVLEINDIEWTSSAKNSDKVVDFISNNYGTATYEFAKILYDYYINNDVEKIIKLYNDFVVDFEEKLGSNVLANRVSKKQTLLMVTAYICKNHLEFDIDLDNIFEFIAENITVSTVSTDITQSIYDYFMEFYSVNQNLFREYNDPNAKFSNAKYSICKLKSPVRVNGKVAKYTMRIPESIFVEIASKKKPNVNIKKLTMDMFDKLLLKAPDRTHRRQKNKLFTDSKSNVIFYELYLYEDYTENKIDKKQKKIPNTLAKLFEE